MEQVDVTVFYLEMLTPSQRTVPAPRDRLTVLHAQQPSVPYYRFLYDAVGNDYKWLSRRNLSDDELAAVIQDPLNEVHVLHVDGSPAGFAELNRRQADEVELLQFGLMRDFTGQGTGDLVSPVDNRQSVDLQAKTLLASHLHAGPSRRRPHLPEG